MRDAGGKKKSVETKNMNERANEENYGFGSRVVYKIYKRRGEREATSKNEERGNAGVVALRRRCGSRSSPRIVEALPKQKMACAATALSEYRGGGLRWNKLGSIWAVSSFGKRTRAPRDGRSSDHGAGFWRSPRSIYTEGELCTGARWPSQFDEGDVDGVLCGQQLEQEGVLVAVVLHHVVVHPHRHAFFAPLKYVLYTGRLYFVLALDRFR